MMERAKQAWRWLDPRVTPRMILLAALFAFLVYAWPGFIGWDSRDHILQARAFSFSDGHPPAVPLLVRICEIFITGPAGVLLVQAITLLVGLNMIFKRRFSPRVAALCAAGVFLWPPISGAQGLIAKDGLMAGSLVIAIGLMLDERPSRHRLALLFVFFASLMRWNALAATFPPMLLLFRWSPTLRGWRRYAIALAMWFGVTAAAYGTNEMLTTTHEHLWYWGHAYLDICGTLEHLGPRPDEELNEIFDGVPLLYHDNIWQRMHAIYSPVDHYHLMRDAGRMFDIPANDEQRAALLRAWKRVVLAHPVEYLAYRWENFQRVIQRHRPNTWTSVYVWFNVIAAPETIPELQHDAGPSRIQARLIEASIWISLTVIYWILPYFVLSFVLLPFCTKRVLEVSLLLSAIGYQLQWFFLAAAPDVRYSQWMELCVTVVAVLLAPRALSVIRRR
ncbi:MAG TPA: hypothetical protein VFV99_11970 [Kofleriaceae bacterium]|nr:hypothetical protein [Kofleriaceae bacterium]